MSIIQTKVYMNCKPVPASNASAEVKASYTWNDDNRIPIAGIGMVNFGFNRNFVFNGGVIGNTDEVVMVQIVDNQENEIIRYVPDAGGDFQFESSSESSRESSSSEPS